MVFFRFFRVILCRETLFFILAQYLRLLNLRLLKTQKNLLRSSLLNWDNIFGYLAVPLDFFIIVFLSLELFIVLISL